jgi:hypothetical protein
VWLGGRVLAYNTQGPEFNLREGGRQGEEEGGRKLKLSVIIKMICITT